MESFVSEFYYLYYIIDGLLFDGSFILLLFLLLRGNPKSWFYFGVVAAISLLYQLIIWFLINPDSPIEPFSLQRFFNVGLAWYGHRHGKQIIISHQQDDILLDAGDILNAHHSNRQAIIYPLLRKNIAMFDVLSIIGSFAAIMLIITGIRNFFGVEHIPIIAGTILQTMLLSVGLVLLANRILQGCVAVMLGTGLGFLTFSYSAIQFSFDADIFTILFVMPNVVLFLQALQLQKQWLRLPLAA